MLTRRTMFGGLLAALAAPAIIRTPGLIMPVKAARHPVGFGVGSGIAPDYDFRIVRPDGMTTYHRQGDGTLSFVIAEGGVVPGSTVYLRPRRANEAYILPCSLPQNTRLIGEPTGGDIPRIEFVARNLLHPA